MLPPASNCLMILFLVVYLGICSALPRGPPASAKYGKKGLQITSANCHYMFYPHEIIHKTVSDGVSTINMKTTTWSKYRDYLNYKPSKNERLPFEAPYFKKLIDPFVPGVERMDQKDYAIFTLQGQLANVISTWTEYTLQQPREVLRTGDCQLGFDDKSLNKILISKH